MAENRRSYFGDIVLSPEEVAGSLFPAGRYEAKEFLRLCKKTKGDRTADIQYAWLKAFRIAGTKADCSMLEQVLKDPRLAEVTDIERSLLRMLGHVYALRVEFVREHLWGFREAHPELSDLAAADREEFETVEAINEYIALKNASEFFTDEDVWLKPTEIAERFYKAGLNNKANIVFKIALRRERETGLGFSEEFKNFIKANAVHLSEPVWSGLAAILENRIEEGLARLIEATLNRNGKECSEEAAILLAEILYDTDHPPFGETVAWNEAQKQSLAFEPNEAPFPNRDMYTSIDRKAAGGKRKRAAALQDTLFEAPDPEPIAPVEEAEFFRLEARRFLRLRAAIAADDFEALRKQVLPRPEKPLITDGFMGVLERACAAALTFVYHGRHHELENAEKVISWLVLKKCHAPKMAPLFLQSVRYYFSDIGVIEPDETEFLWDELEEEAEGNKRFKTVFDTGCRFAARFTKNRAFREGLAKGEMLLAEVKQAAEQGNAHCLNEFIAKLKAVPWVQRGAAWWTAAAYLVDLPEGIRRFTDNEELGLIQYAQSMNTVAPDKNDDRRRQMDSMLFMRGFVDNENSRCELPMCFAPSWFGEIEKLCGRISGWFLLLPHIAVILVEPRGNNKDLFLISTSLDPCKHLVALEGSVQVSPIELVARFPKRRLRRNGMPSYGICNIFVEAFTAALRQLNLTGRIEFDRMFFGTPQGTRLDPDLPFTALRLSDPDQSASIKPASDLESGGFVRFIDIEVLLPDELQKVLDFGGSWVMNTVDRDRLKYFDSHRISLFLPLKPLVNPDEPLPINVPSGLAEEKCFVERSILEKGDQIQTISVVGYGSFENKVLYFSTQDFIKEPSKLRQIDPLREVFVPLKYVFAIFPEVETVLDAARKGAVGRRKDGQFVQLFEFDSGATDPSVEKSVGVTNIGHA